VVRDRQRRRQLARAKWERQNQKRSVRARRERTVGIVFGVACAILLVGGVVWLFVHNSEGDDTQPTTTNVSTTTPTTAPTSTPTSAPSTSSTTTTTSTTATSGTP
jgi:peptidyl-prolyl cis-trans isomerase B (cyclophilin B)